MAVKKPNTASRSRTETRQGETQQAVPRLPYERDESADSQARGPASAQVIGQLAHDDQVRGLADTSRAPETDATYHRLRRAPAQRKPPVRRPR
ncbi:MAG: hypothetical protein RIS88_1247 [Pseudomonadota bacterium]|jgi:hypothetical protein